MSSYCGAGERRQYQTQKISQPVEVKSEVVGDKPYARIEARHVREWMDDRADRPEAANGLLKTLKGLFAFAEKRRFVASSPLAQINKVKVSTNGFHTWTVDEVHKFEQFHPIGTKPRLVLTIGLFLGLRRSKIATVGRQNVEDGMIVLRPGKVRLGSKERKLHLPILPQLQEAFENTVTGNMTFITTDNGKPYSPASLGGMFRDWCDQAGLPHCTLHGLRKAGATIAANNGAIDRQLMAIYGWARADMATLYTEQADRMRQAKMGMGFLVPNTKEEQANIPPPKWVGQTERKTK